MKKLYSILFAGSFLIANNALSQCDNSTTLVVDLQMQNSTADSSFYNQTIYVYGTPTFEADRNGNASSALNTTNGSIFLYDDVLGEFKCPFPFTYSGWIKANQLNARNPVFMNEDHGSAYSGAWVNVLQTGEVTANIGDGGGPSAANVVTATTNSQLITTGVWNHIAVVFNSLTDIKIYINGVQQNVTYSGTGSQLYYYQISGTAGKIGSGVNGSGTNVYFNGLIDDVRFWTTSLVDIQVQAIYNSHFDFISVETLSICNDNEFTDVTAPGGQCDYNWSNGDNDNTNSIYGGLLGDGVHTIYATAYDNNNILFTDSVIVTVSTCTGVNEELGMQN